MHSQGDAQLALTARSLGTLGASAVYLGSAVVGSVVMARMLGVEDRGVVAAAVLPATIAAYVGELGVPAATGYFVSRDRDRRGAIVGTAGTLALLLSAVLVVVSIGATLVLSLPEGARTLALAFAAFVPLNLFQRIHLAVLQAELKIGAFNVVRVAGAVVYVVALGLLPLVGAATTGGVIAALLVGNLVWCGLAAALVGRPLLRRRPDHARRLLGYGLRAHLGSMTPLDTLRLDQLVLALFLPAAALGLYVTAMTVAIANRLLGVSLGVVAFPVAARTPPGQARRPFLQLLVTTAVLSTVAAAFEIAFGRQLLALLFPPEFADAYPPLVLLVLASVLMNIRGVAGDWLRGAGRPGVAALGEAVLLAVLLPGFVLFWNGRVTGVAAVVLAASAAALVATGVLARPGAGGKGRTAAERALDIDEGVRSIEEGGVA